MTAKKDLMWNIELVNFSIKWLKKHIVLCTAEQQMRFRRMYDTDMQFVPTPVGPLRSIHVVIDTMQIGQLDWAMVQVYNTLKSMGYELTENGDLKKGEATIDGQTAERKTAKNKTAAEGNS